MALSNITIVRQNGALAGTPTDDSGISGLLIYTDLGSASTAGYYNVVYQATDALVFCSETDLIYYHIKEYFTQTKYPLYVALVNRIPSATDSFIEVQTLQLFASGSIKQIGVFNTLGDFATGQIAKLQLIAESCEEDYQPLQIIYSAPINVLIEAMPDFSTASNNRVSFLLGEDGTVGGEVEALYTSGEIIVGSIGVVLGLIAKSFIQESIAHVAKFDVSGNIPSPSFIDGTKLNTKSKAVLDALDNKGYIFFRSFVSYAGVFVNYGTTLTNRVSDDFSTIERNRVYDSAYRGLRSAYMPQLNGTVYLDLSGKIATGAIKQLEGIGENILNNMKNSGNISNFTIEIDPNQLILNTNTLFINVKIQPVGISKYITINLGFSLTA